MDCRAFRKRHLAFVDDTLPGVEIVQMRDHLNVCAGCSAWDYRVRRSLLVAKNHLNAIEPSEAFSRRLTARLDAERAHRLTSTAGAGAPLRWSALAAVGLVVVVIGASVVALAGSESPGELARLPAVTTLPDRETTRLRSELPSATPSFVASVSTGMAILPALMLAEEVPIRRVNQQDPRVAVRTTGLTYPTPVQR